MNQEVSRDDNYGKDYCAKVSERISKMTGKDKCYG